MRISAIFIAKNEEEIVRTALESVKDFDEIIFVDTGSTDKTIEIAKEYTDKIFHFPWIKDFSAARNFAIEQATGDWCYSIDCDHQLITPYEEFKKEVERLSNEGHTVLKVKTLMGKSKIPLMEREVLFKNSPEIRWIGAVHECISPKGTATADITRWCGYSKNHYSEPERNIEILLSQLITQRSRFYLGREYYELRRYEEAIKWMEEYLKEATWIPEKGEAWLVIARCYWFLQKGDDARKACYEAIKINPDFKEALLLMATMHFEPWKHKWERLAASATNEDVLFIRT